MPDRLSRRATLLLVALAFALTFTAQMLLSGGSSARQAEPAGSARAAVANTPATASAPQLRLVAAGTVPALRDPRRPRKPRARRRKPKRIVPNVVKAAPTVQPAPMTPAATAQPAPTAVAPRPQPKPAAPQPTPAPTTPPPSGDFDTSGDP